VGRSYEPEGHALSLDDSITLTVRRRPKPPSKRTYIPKADGRQRPLGIAALEDKIVQHAVVTVLNQIYEEDFLGSLMVSDPGDASMMRWMRSGWES